MKSNPSPPSSSPPRKKKETEVEEEINDSVEMMDIGIEANDIVFKMLEERIKELECNKTELENEIKKLKSEPSDLSANIISKKPKHLFKVHEANLPKLKGYSWRYRALANGACANNCLAVHIYENEDEGENVKRRTLDHIADNYYNYYQNKIGLPYVETVGVGEKSTTVEIETDDDMIKFLRSDKALKVYSNTHELLAMANLYNIRINVFSYGGSGEDGWTQICPDPKMVSEAQAKLGQCIQDAALYHSYDTHYDLLVKRDSRIALLGLEAGTPNSDSEERGDTSDEWISVKNMKKNASKVGKSANEEELLVETETQESNNPDLVEEITLVESKKSGFRRTGPQDTPSIGSRKSNMNKCTECKFEFESAGILEAHKQTHRKQITCSICSKQFNDQSSVDEHKQNEHKPNIYSDEWTCDDCPFQANCAAELMKHLKVSGHQPGKNIKDKRKVFEDYKQCFTCKMDFDGFYNLMNHRKKVHPSSKKCRNFSTGKCTFGVECWYVHGEENEDTIDNFKCDLCSNTFKGRTNFMNHKKLLHPEYIPPCEKFRANNCPRSNKECWFEHKIVENYPNENNPWPKLIPSSPAHTEKQVFQEVTGNTLPPDQVGMMMEMVGKLCKKVEGLEEKIKSLVPK